MLSSYLAFLMCIYLISLYYKICVQQSSPDSFDRCSSHFSSHIAECIYFGDICDAVGIEIVDIRRKERTVLGRFIYIMYLSRPTMDCRSGFWIAYMKQSRTL